MKIPLSWLKEYVPLTVSVADLAERLTRAGLEVSSVRCLGLPWPEGLKVKNVETGPVWERDKVILAEVIKVEKHPDADKLKLPTVAYGEGRVKTLVTGAPNIAVGDVGQKVVLGLEGFEYFDGHVQPKQLKRLKGAKVRGVMSDAMACSSYELGIDEEHEGIILLEREAPVGVPAADYLGDYVLDLEITPNIARALSVIGVAREVAALTGQSLKLPPAGVEAKGGPIQGQVNVVIEDANLSARYMAMLLKDVTIGPSPQWMQRRLSYAGMRPINNVVDITNYVMLEWGQPLHAFDYDKLKARAGGKAPTIIVRPAKPGEKLLLLDQGSKAPEERRATELSPEDLVIADTAGPIALAGVMGGLETEVSDSTKNILLEAASFDPVSIRKTARRLNQHSEASSRFSKGIHPEVVKPAAERASELMRLYGGAKVAAGSVDVYPAEPKPQTITLKLNEVRRLLGMDIPAAECARILRTLEFKVEEKGDALTVTAPPHRLDIQEGAADLIEDLVRLYGYDKLPATQLAAPLPPQSTEPPNALEERLRDLLVDCGLQECITYALTTPERETLLGVPAGEYVTLLNPISAERTVMRHSVLSSLLEVLATNLKQTDDARLFEVGTVYLPRAGQKLPDEPRRLALAITGTRTRPFWAETVKSEYTPLDFYDLKGVVEELAVGLHLSGVTYRPTKDVPYLHPGQAAEIVVGETVLGVFGLLHPRTANKLDLADKTVLVAEIDVEKLRAAVPPRHKLRPVATFPPALRDIAILVPESVTADQVLREIRAGGGDLLVDARLFDLYRGESIPAGQKSLAYALVYQAPDRTLTDKDIEKAHNKVGERLKHVLKATIRAPK